VLSKQAIAEALAKNTAVSLGEGPPHAAVLVLLKDPEPGHEEDGPVLILEQRTEQLKAHPGEVCFAGGRHEPGRDATPLDTALREATEEIGVDAKDVEIIGRLSEYCVRNVETKSCVRIAPFVGWWIGTDARRPSVASCAEVARLLEVGFREIVRGLREESLEIVDGSGSAKLFPIYRFPCRSITDGTIVESWGATAHIAVDLAATCGILPGHFQHPQLRPTPADVDNAANRTFHKQPVCQIQRS
jgi:8-oxo-dGTP pyrophosphatase MutT (NUDIX family)